LPPETVEKVQNIHFLPVANLFAKLGKPFEGKKLNALGDNIIK